MTVKTYNIIYITVLILLIFLILLSIFNRFYKNQNVKENFDGNVVTTEMTAVKDKLLIQKPINITSFNWGITFTIKLNSGHNGTWQQIIGVTPYSDGRDGRIFGAWLCPDQDGIHLRTATTTNSNAEITWCYSLGKNKYYRFDIISNPTSDNNKQNVLAFMTSYDNNNNGNTTMIANVLLDPPLYSPNNAQYNKAYVYSTYTGYNPFKGTIKDIELVYIKQGNGTITTQNLYNAVNKIEDIAANINKTESFTNINSTIKEGLDNIGGIGDNSGIKPISPPTNSVDVPLALNYKPIKSEDGLKDLCARSVIQPSDYKFNWISQYNFNYPLEFDSKGKVKTSVPICSPDELYTIQSQILNELNAFNSEYSDYMTFLYNYNHNVPGDTSEQLPYASGISDDIAEKRYIKLATATSSGKLSGNIQKLDSYKRLINDIKTYNNLLKANQFYYPDPEKDKNNKVFSLSRMDPIILKKNHDEIIKERNELDLKLFELNNVQNSAAHESKMQMDSGIYVTLLWTTLATSIIYFMFV